MTAAATTGPKREPRPTSSAPATMRAPVSQARFSNFNVHRRLLSNRSLAAAGDMPAAFEFRDRERKEGLPASSPRRRMLASPPVLQSRVLRGCRLLLGVLLCP